MAAPSFHSFSRVGEIFGAYDPDMPEGQRLPPEMRAEIARLAPANLTPNSVTQDKIADGAVGRDQLDAKAVDATRLADGAVGQAQLALGAVGSNQLAPGAVTAAKAGAGILKFTDPSGTPIAGTVIVLTSTQYAALTSPDPNTIYLLGSS